MYWITNLEESRISYKNTKYLSRRKLSYRCCIHACSNVNFSIHSYVNGNEKQEILFLEIWTNGSLTPKEVLYEASRNLIDLFIPFLHADEKNLNLENNQDKVTLPLFTFHDGLAKLRKN